MTEFMAKPDDLGEIQASELHTSLGTALGAYAGEAFMGGVRTVARLGQYQLAESGNDTFEPDEFGGGRFVATRPHPEISIDDARARVKSEGLDGHLKLPEQPNMRQGVLDLMIAHAHERREFAAATERGPTGSGALGFITELGVGIVDPVNIAAFAIPVLGEARYGQMLASAGSSFLRRAGVKALVGAGQGAVGSAVIEPANWWLHTKDGQDYTYADALRSVVMGAAMGGVMHAGFGAIGDVRASLRGQPMKGSPADVLLRGLAAADETVAPGAEPAGLRLVRSDEPRDPEKGDLRGPGADYLLKDGDQVVGNASFTDLGDGHYHLDWIGSREGFEGSPLDLGPSSVRNLLRQFLAEHPDARRISGSRVAGARGETSDYGAAPVEFDVVDGRLRLRQQSGLPLPADIFADLPPRVREDLVHIAAADVINDRPGRAGEALAIAARHDPRIAESLELGRHDRGLPAGARHEEYLPGDETLGAHPEKLGTIERHAGARRGLERFYAQRGEHYSLGSDQARREQLAGRTVEAVSYQKRPDGNYDLYYANRAEHGDEDFPHSIVRRKLTPEQLDAHLGQAVADRVRSGEGEIDPHWQDRQKGLRGHAASEEFAERTLTGLDLKFGDAGNPMLRISRTGEARLEQLSPLAREKRTEIEAMLTQAARRVLGNHVKEILFPDAIPLLRAAQGWGEQFKDVRSAAGSYSPREFGGPRIKVAMADPRYRYPFSTLLHESWHAVQDLLLTDAEKRVLAREHGRMRTYIEQHAGLTAEQVAGMATHEVEAVAFERYAAMRAKAMPEPLAKSAGGRFAAVFDKLLELLERMYNGLAGLGFQRAEDLFAKAYEGRMAARTENTTGLHAEPRLYSLAEHDGEAAEAPAHHALKFRDYYQHLVEANGGGAQGHGAAMRTLSEAGFKGLHVKERARGADVDRYMTFGDNLAAIVPRSGKLMPVSPDGPMAGHLGDAEPISRTPSPAPAGEGGEGAPRENMLAKFMSEREVEAKQRGPMQRPIAEVAADFRKLNDQPPDPEVVGDRQASRAADAAPEPASVDAMKAPSEAERLAAEADALLKDIEPMLTDAEKERFTEALDLAVQDRAARETIYREGAACLLGAVA